MAFRDKCCKRNVNKVRGWMLGSLEKSFELIVFEQKWEWYKEPHESVWGISAEAVVCVVCLRNRNEIEQSEQCGEE